jgi:hypothetical protein
MVWKFVSSYIYIVIHDKYTCTGLLLDGSQRQTPVAAKSGAAPMVSFDCCSKYTSPIFAPLNDNFRIEFHDAVNQLVLQSSFIPCPFPT